MITICLIATRNYIQHCNNLIADLEKNCRNAELQLLIFSDNPPEILKTRRHVAKTILIPSFGWPEATIKRYELISENHKEIRGNYVIYMDSDLRVMRNFVPEFIRLTSSEKMSLVAHPGFWRPKRIARIMLYLTSPKLLMRDIRRRILIGGLGSWETSVKSTAFVARKMRRSYVCGGFWGGTKNIVLGMCGELAESVRIDNQNNVVAVWHDESHLNAWLSKNDSVILTPEFCLEVEYRNLKNLNPYVIAVSKSEETKNRLK